MADDKDIEGSDLSALIASEIRNSLSFDMTEQTSKRELALAYMRGEMPDLPPRPNGSKQTSRDVADTISWILPGIVRVFTASSQMVIFDQVREEDDRWASEATEYTNYSFFRENDGYRILYNASNDSLLMGNGVACSYWEPEETETKTFKDLQEVDLAVLTEEGWTPISAKLGKPMPVEDMDPMTGDVVVLEMPTITAKMQRVVRPGRIKDMTCIPENLFLDKDATTIEDARVVGYLLDGTTRSDLLEMAEDYGWDAAAVEAIKQAPRYNRSVATIGSLRENEYHQNDSPVASGDPMEFYQVFPKYDVDGDGIAERLRVWYLGNGSTGTVLGWEEWDDDIPYTDIPCYPVPHQFEAESVFDRTADIQRVKTTLLRQALDNTYASNMPMREADQGSVLNPEILVNPKFGGIIWKKQGSAPIVPHVIPFTADKSFAALEYMDQIIAKRTGVSKTTMALDPETLQNQTATSSQLQHDAGYSQVELIARNMAELGWSKFFKKRLKLAIKYEQVRKIPSDNGDPVPNPETGQEEPGKFREISPAKWDAEMAVSINVGLGTGSRDRDMSMLNLILNGQIGMADRLGAAGFTSKALEFLPKIRNTAVKMAESSGLKNPEEYYPEITDEELAQMKEQANQPPPPDPAIQIEQMKGDNAKALKEVDGQVAVEQARIKAEGDIIKNQAELEADLETARADRENALILQQQKAQHDYDLDAQRIASTERIKLAELKWAEYELNAKTALEREKMASAAQIAAMKPKPEPKQAGKPA